MVETQEKVRKRACPVKNENVDLSRLPYEAQ